MKDLYKRLGIDAGAAEQQVREAIASSAAAPDAQARDAAAFVLLDPARRAAYDRTHRVLSTIGQLRSHLGLNLAPFWARGQFRDYTHDLTPPPAATPRRFPRPMRMVRAIRPADITRAFGLRGRQYQAETERRRRRLLSVALLLVTAGLAVAGVMVYSLYTGR